MTPFAILLFASVVQPAVPDQRECYDYDLFADVVERGGGKITQTIETPGFPTSKRLLVVTLEGTKEVFATGDDCVIVPAVFVDAPDGLERIPFLNLLKPKPAA